MNIDDLTQRFRARWLGRSTDGDESPAEHNRSTLRAAGIQGRTGTTVFEDGMAQGPRRGTFFGAGHRPAILISNTPKRRRIDRQTARSRRTKQRMRAQEGGIELDSTA